MPRTRRRKPSNDRNPVLHVSSSRDPSKQRTWFDNFLNMPRASKSPSACHFALSSSLESNQNPNSNSVCSQKRVEFVATLWLHRFGQFKSFNKKIVQKHRFVRAGCTSSGSTSFSISSIFRFSCSQPSVGTKLWDPRIRSKNQTVLDTFQKECAKKSKTTGTNINT